MESSSLIITAVLLEILGKNNEIYISENFLLVFTSIFKQGLFVAGN